MKRNSEHLTPVKVAKKLLNDSDTSDDDDDSCELIEGERLLKPSTFRTMAGNPESGQKLNLSENDVVTLVELWKHPKVREQQINDLTEAMKPTNAYMTKLTNNIVSLTSRINEQEAAFKNRIHEQNLVIRTTLDRHSKEIKESMDKQTQRIEKLEEKVESEVDNRITSLEAEVRRLEFVSKEHSLKIRGLEEEENEDTTSKVVALITDNLGINFNSSDIQECYREGASEGGKPRHIHLKISPR